MVVEKHENATCGYGCKNVTTYQYRADCCGDGIGPYCLRCWKYWFKNEFLPELKKETE